MKIKMLEGVGDGVSELPANSLFFSCIFFFPFYLDLASAWPCDREGVELVCSIGDMMTKQVSVDWDFIHCINFVSNILYCLVFVCLIYM